VSAAETITCSDARSAALCTTGGVTYPSYKSLDPYIDIATLRALDGFLIERIESHIAAEKDDFFLNQHRLDDATPYQPGVREIWLSRTLPGRLTTISTSTTRICGAARQRRKNSRRS
jgi:hypothetical protein